MNILVVDDEGSFGKLVARVLSREGMSVTTTTRGAEAVALLEQTNPGLVIVDYMLKEERDGLDLIQAMRVKRPELPALLISGFPSDDVELRVATMGGTYYLEKPFESQELLKLVHYIVDRENLSGPDPGP
jgi:two-component system nitrogen regulation response regulator NtrX